IHGPSRSPPVITLRTPGGSSSRIWSTARSTVSGVNGDGFRTTVSPTSNAGRTLRKESMNGRFQGLMAQTTPSGDITLHHLTDALLDPPLFGQLHREQRRPVE